MDFIECLPKVHGKSVILTVVDRFSKYTHFIALGHPSTSMTVTRAFFDSIIRLHRFPTFIVSDRDLVFMGHVWRDLFKMAGITLHMSMVFHPYIDEWIDGWTIRGGQQCSCHVPALLTGDRLHVWVD
jgi:hypothetical protein